MVWLLFIVCCRSDNDLLVVSISRSLLLISFCWFFKSSICCVAPLILSCIWRSSSNCAVKIELGDSFLMLVGAMAIFHNFWMVFLSIFWYCLYNLSRSALSDFPRCIRSLMPGKLSVYISSIEDNLLSFSRMAFSTWPIRGLIFNNMLRSSFCCASTLLRWILLSPNSEVIWRKRAR